MILNKVIFMLLYQQCIFSSRGAQIKSTTISSVFYVPWLYARHYTTLYKLEITGDAYIMLELFIFVEHIVNRLLVTTLVCGKFVI